MMKEVKVLLVDDELPACETLAWLMKEYCPQFTIAGMVQSAEEARKFMTQQKPDVIFLDISMPGENGFEFLQSVSNPDFMVVFVTAHDEYAIRAFRESAVDYLLKPVDADELKQAAEKIAARLQHEHRNDNEGLKQLISSFASKSVRIAIPHAEGIHIVPARDIVYLEADSNYTVFHLLNGSKIVASKTMAEFEQQLPDTFFRIHKSFNINLPHVTEYVKKDGNSVLMNDGALLPVSRRKNEELLQALLTH